MSKFSALGLNEKLCDIIKDVGYTEPTKVQSAAISAILDGKDVLAGAQTGTGKTAAFALPIIQTLDASPQTKLRALILTPTRELAVQVNASVKKYAKQSALKTALVYGGVSIKAQIEQLEEGVDVLIATPGRLLDLISQQVVDLQHISHLVFDEADRMLDMGFIVDIKRLMKKLPSNRQTLLFSATFSEDVFNLSQQFLTDPLHIEVDDRNSTAQTVEQMVYAVDQERKRELLSYMIGSKNWKQVLIFTRTKQEADQLAKEMCKDGLKTQSIHGDKSQGARERALEEFKIGKIRALVATDVAARGLDIDSLEYVVNYELPYNAEDYVHRIGRTGRAGNAGNAISLVDPSENYLLEEIEALLDKKLPQQWLPGYEPDPNKPPSKKNRHTEQKKRQKQRAFGAKKNPRRRR